jgi:predicted nucleotidyltransferase
MGAPRSVADIESVIPGAQGRMLAALLRVGERRTISDLARLAGVSRDRGATVVDHLARIGLVERQRAGRAWLVSVVEEHPVIESLRQIEDSNARSISKLTRAAAALVPQPDVMVLYGSWARRSAGPDSDLDVAVVAGDDNAGDELLAGLEAWLRFAERVTGLAPSLIVADNAQEAVGPLWNSIRRDGVPLVDRVGYFGAAHAG